MSRAHFGGAERETASEVPARWVGDEYFETIRLPLLRGRSFERSDTLDSEPVVIVDELLAERLGRSALGSSLRLHPGTRLERTVRIVGIAARRGTPTWPRARSLRSIFRMRSTGRESGSC